MVTTKEMSESLANRPRRRGGLARDENGAILIAGIFVSAFLVGALYMLVGASTAMQHGERMQDAADSAAFSSAQLHAKGMNLIVLNNMVKVGALATITAHGSIVLGAIDTIRWISRRRWRRRAFGWLRPWLAAIAGQAGSKYSSSRSRIDRIIKAADTSQKALRDNLSLVAEEVVNREFQSAFDAPVKALFVSPVTTMPLEFESTFQMCQRMWPYADRINRKAFKQIPVGYIRNKAKRYTRKYFMMFCFIHGKPAMKLKSGGDVVPGGDAFQIKVYSAGEELSTAGEKGVQVATWGGGSDDDITRMRDEVSRLAFAQAEYYFSGSTSKEGAMWEMNWRARLRRFEWKGGSIAGDCARRGGPGTACSALPTYLNDMEWATIH